MLRNRFIDDFSDNESLSTAYYDYPTSATEKQGILHNLHLINDYVKLLEDEKQDENYFADEKTEEFLQQSEELELKLEFTQQRCRTIEKNLEFLRTLAENGFEQISSPIELKTRIKHPKESLRCVNQRAVPLKPPNQPTEEIIHVDDDPVIHKVWRENGVVSPAFVVTRLGNYQKLFIRERKPKNCECSSLSEIYKTAQDELNQLVRKINQLEHLVSVESDSQLEKALKFQLQYFKNEEKNKQRQIERLRKFLQKDQSKISANNNHRLTKKDLTWH